MAKVKPFKRNGTWLFSDGTVIPDQARANADVRYRETSNNLHLLVSAHSGNREVNETVDAQRQRVGWDSDIPKDDDLDAAILDYRLGAEVETEHDEVVGIQIASLEHKLDLCDESCPVSGLEVTIEQRELILA